DYVVTKIPRWAFEKFPEANSELTVQMKSVGEVMAIGRTFKESLQKALRGLEIGRAGLGADGKDKPIAGSGSAIQEKDALIRAMRTPNRERLFQIAEAFRLGASVEEIHEASGIDPWFLRQMREIITLENEIRNAPEATRFEPAFLRRVKQHGFSDRQLGWMWGMSEDAVRQRRKAAGVMPGYRLVDTCAAEFEAYTPYYYSTYDATEDETRLDETKEQVIILGGGPNRIGQGIEFDYCCVHAVFALRELGYETVMVNCNPETVSTDYDTADRLFFEPVTFEDVMNIVDRVKPRGVIVQFGGQTPLNLALRLKAAGAPIVGTTPENIARAEDRELFREAVERLGLLQPRNATATSFEEAAVIADQVGYPVVVRP
ncbi:MAG TPA: carbamoyl-phosphate synthase large subunit, partial [Candidatus Hydrogenedentes bacterium]|nr:carbamoyl-phosphate synthase large subunit [Candidatus Hydrogenedentota bacterium]